MRKVTRETLIQKDLKRAKLFYLRRNWGWAY
jgi:ribosomal protein L19